MDQEGLLGAARRRRGQGTGVEKALGVARGRSELGKGDEIGRVSGGGWCGPGRGSETVLRAQDGIEGIERALRPVIAFGLAGEHRGGWGPKRRRGGEDSVD